MATYQEKEEEVEGSRQLVVVIVHSTSQRVGQTGDKMERTGRRRQDALEKKRNIKDKQKERTKKTVSEKYKEMQLNRRKINGHKKRDRLREREKMTEKMGGEREKQRKLNL